MTILRSKVLKLELRSLESEMGYALVSVMAWFPVFPRRASSHSPSLKTTEEASEIFV